MRISFGMATKKMMMPIMMLMTSVGAPITSWIFEPPYFRAPNRRPAKTQPGPLLLPISDTAMPSKPYPSMIARVAMRWLTPST